MLCAGVRVFPLEKKGREGADVVTFLEQGFARSQQKAARLTVVSSFVQLGGHPKTGRAGEPHCPGHTCLLVSFRLSFLILEMGIIIDGTCIASSTVSAYT